MNVKDLNAMIICKHFEQESNKSTNLSYYCPYQNGYILIFVQKFACWLSWYLNVLHILNFVHIMCLNYDDNLTNRRTSVRKCNFKQKDIFRLLHS